MKTRQLMLYREIIAVCSEIRTKHLNTLCELNVGFLDIEHGGTLRSLQWLRKVPPCSISKTPTYLYLYFETLKKEFEPNYLKRSSPYRAANTPRHGYKNQSVNAV